MNLAIFVSWRGEGLLTPVNGGYRIARGKRSKIRGRSLPTKMVGIRNVSFAFRRLRNRPWRRLRPFQRRLGHSLSSIGHVDFAFGAFGGVSAFLAWQLTHDGVPAPISWIVGITVSTGIAYCYGRIFA